jgi:ABC-type Fe3+-hydroxamate transport system substrate-binding protein
LQIAKTTRSIDIELTLEVLVDMYLRQLLTICTVSTIVVASLTGCNSSEPTTSASTSASTSPSAVSSTAPSTSASANGAVAELLAAIGKIKTAATAGDFAKALAEYKAYDEIWEKVENGIKAKSKDNYEKIESSMDALKAALKESNPVKDKVLAAIQALETVVNKAKN